MGVAPVRGHGLDRVVKFHTPQIVFGPGTIGEVVNAVSALGIDRPLLVSDQQLAQTPWLDRVVSDLRQRGLVPETFLGVTPNPRAAEVEAGRDVYVAHRADGLVAVGGGSVIDAAKGVAVLASNDGHILEYEGIDRATRSLPPLVAVPTTSGSGSDVSQFCIVNDTHSRTKVTIIGRNLVPNVAVIDPTLVTTAAPEVIAQAGMDALTHCVEAFVSLARGRLTDALAVDALVGVWTNLERLVQDPSDPDAGAEMSLASLRAGMAFTNAILGAAHAMSHPVGGYCDAPHGAINSVLLPPVIRYNATVCADDFVHLADAVGLSTAGGDRVVADRLADAIADLAHRVGMPSALSPLGVAADDLEWLTQRALADSCMLTNPRPAAGEAILDVYRQAL
ncbi:iron-containing alcohol dehydrogenase [Gordonia crocea]|uniref:1,3-propanediol dehydrogenase n=1 Tax=Gordonia crocea TaxID=589162 RepID=A0A7I9UXC9_9ACTN|nr:iron-containing alcohol dehydrogenase [Gordonia crocea]GED97460.1 1,3-propanediol dehydrogenase [Gordonia crocea]